MYKKGRVNSNSRIISTDEDPSLRIESSAIINLRGVSTKLNKYKALIIVNHALASTTNDGFSFAVDMNKLSDMHISSLDSDSLQLVTKKFLRL